ncbi:type IV secretory system conjugative DNA transfer family protein [Aurantimicrobium minutum]|uniref:type IV secretory system conjugative DNA transfer family protein n=1 Tax=Aurantimicrobium minutum TaxID=708131 RepID=UPI002476FC5F|nr:type IV secretory system conjugative DNA transfer family protein [Aurantimicrobium minutum]MDH6422295.1 type IV secretory pathway TraG/TraD family ATPase VirD4 [Aurantimicrobium minutum]
MDVLWEWVSSPERARAAVNAIREHPYGMSEHANHLEEVINMPPEQRATQWSVLPTVLAFLESRSAREWLKPTEDTRMNLVEFILGKGTLYLVGDKAAAAGFVRIIDGLLAELDYVSKGLANASPGGRLDPPLSYILDEAGNFTYQGLPELITAGGGRGRIAVAVFQSKSQLAGWGEENAKTMWDAAVAKILLPGGGDARELGDFSELVGNHYIQRESHTFGHSLTPSVSVSEERRAVLEAHEIRELKSGYSIMFYRHLKPVIVKMNGFDQQRHFAKYVADSAELAQLMKEASPFAHAIDTYNNTAN